MLWQKKSEAAVREMLTQAKRQARKRLETEVRRAIDYMNGQQLEDVRGELRMRYPRTQAGKIGQEIKPFIIPLVERFRDEQANAYNRGVIRRIVPKVKPKKEDKPKPLPLPGLGTKLPPKPPSEGEEPEEPSPEDKAKPDGFGQKPPEPKPLMSKTKSPEEEEAEKLTDIYNEFLKESDFNAHMHMLDGYLCILKNAGLWFQVARGKMVPQVVTIDNIFEVADPDNPFANAAQQDDYLGFIIRMQQAAYQDTALAQPQGFVFSAAAQQTYYTTSDGDPYGIAEQVKNFDNPFTWMQMEETPDHKGKLSELPLQMFTIWHKHLVSGKVICDSDSDIVHANREINIAMSMLLDTISHQSWAVPVMKLLNQEAAPKTMAWGSRFPIAIMKDEEFELASAATPYQEVVGALVQAVKLLAIAHRMSPNDFAVEGNAPESGFAKMVDNLPKIEARNERCARLSAQEENLAFPRIAAIMKYLGKEGFEKFDTEKFKLTVEFEDLDYPETVEEQTLREEHELKHNLTTRSKMLAKRKRIPLDEAETEIESNKEANAPQKAEELEAEAALKPEPFGGKPPFGGGKPGGGSRFGGKIGKKTTKPPEPPAEEK